MDPLVAAALTAGALAVEHRSSLGLMVSQPLCGGLVTGLVLGAPGEGFLAGALLQMIFLGHVPVRGERVPDLPVGGVTASALFILAGRPVAGDPLLGGIVLVCSLVAGLLAAELGGRVYRWWERRAACVADAALRYAREGKLVRISAIHLSTLLVHFAVAFSVLTALVAAGRPLIGLCAAKLAAASGETLSSVSALVPFIGVGALVRLHAVRTRLFWFGAGFLVSCVAVLIRG
jgi:mannose/fructose/N-acetylgalactosamine-specific phosphotransferase system component IIC